LNLRPRRLPSPTDASREARDARRSRLLSDGHTVTAISGAARALSFLTTFYGVYLVAG
jgi:hypothetical protein